VPLDVLRTTSVMVTRSPLAYLVLLVAVDQARALSAQVGAAARLTLGAVVVVTAPGARSAVVDVVGHAPPGPGRADEPGRVTVATPPPPPPLPPAAVAAGPVPDGPGPDDPAPVGPPARAEVVGVAGAANVRRPRDRPDGPDEPGAITSASATAAATVGITVMSARRRRRSPRPRW
jgi:hypothetical protein